MSATGGLEKLNIEAFEKSNYSGKTGEFSVQINPASYSRSYEICYNNVQPQGSSSGSPEFNRTKSNVVTFDLIFDATGVVPSPVPGKPPATSNGVADQIERFLNLVFSFDGKIHSPKFLRLQWGSAFIFDCRLTKLDLEYTMFAPDGTPLRAKAASSFAEYTNKVELAKEENKSSPDLSHVRVVKAGDTLPLLCSQIYGSSEHYVQVAAANNLVDFRNLTTGSTLIFPPLANDRVDA